MVSPSCSRPGGSPVHSSQPTRALPEFPDPWSTSSDGDALRAGASEFLLKDSGGQRIVRAVEQVAQGDMPVAASVMARLVRSFVVRGPERESGAELTDLLSARELEVLVLVGRGLSNAEIADELVISMATVKSHVRHVLAKLDLRDRVQAVVLAHEQGLV
jgi:DNA-binding NarL/FixJ family response regulator